jgi:hypothetical protein
MNPILYRLLKKRVSPKSYVWLEDKLEGLGSNVNARGFYLAFGACPRFVGKERIDLTEAEHNELSASYPNFGATEWTADQLARILFTTALPTETNAAILDRLYGTADYREQVALYKGLYFLDNASDFVGRAREGLRTNITDVFDAIALDNPYPARYLPEDAWNQMVLKAMFMQRPMYRIYRIEDRKNPRLAEILLDYAEERRSAHRPVSPELWRFVAGYPSERARELMSHVADSGTPLERQAVNKALNPTDGYPDWDDIGRQSVAA